MSRLYKLVIKLSAYSKLKLPSILISGYGIFKVKAALKPASISSISLPPIDSYDQRELF